VAGWFDTTIGFGDRDADLTETSVAMGVSRRFGPDLSVRVAAGAVLGGTLETESREFDVGTGVLASVAVSYRWSLGPKKRWFVSATGAFSASFTDTTEKTAGAPTESLSAMDLRVGVIAGATIARRFSPYLLARGFGGPVGWTLDGEELTGSDRNKYQVGAGVSVTLPANINLVIDGSALGERSASLGASLSF
jgi:hypothetical protein